MCFVVGKAWHGLNQTSEKPVTWEEARQMAHLTFTVSKRKLVHPNNPSQFINAWGIFRDDNQQFLATVGGAYTPVQFDYGFQFVDSLMGEAGGSHYESAGALGNGNKYWCLARVPSGDFSIMGTEDKNQCYVLFSSSHDGTMATTARLTQVRVVCNNTLTLALKSGHGTVVKIKHTTNGKDRLEAAKKLMGGVINDSKELEEKLNILARRKLNKDTFLSALMRVFPGDETATRHNNLLSRIAEIFDSNDNNAIPQIKGTAYNLLNAITNYVDHERGVRITGDKKERGMTESMRRAESAIFGSGNDLKEFALNTLLDETANCPLIPAPTAYFDQQVSIN
jgi:phage/plasmid-like protein (TIGR03299 family)